jgi:predicted small secreted protein
VGSTEATIKISSSKNFNEKADYIVEYKEQTDKKWKQIDGSYPLGQEVTVNITKLKAKTKYNVRTVILTGDNGNKERWTTIITKCLGTVLEKF